MNARIKNHLCKDVPKSSLVHICEASRGADTLAQNEKHILIPSNGLIGIKNHLCKDVPKSGLVHICEASRGANTLA
jgi:hypothetical protein